MSQTDGGGVNMTHFNNVSKYQTENLVVSQITTL